MEKQPLKPGDRVYLTEDHPKDNLYTGDTGTVVETRVGLAVRFDKNPDHAYAGVISAKRNQYLSIESIVALLPEPKAYPFNLGDRVIVRSNYPDDKLFNGDTGRVVDIAGVWGVEFDKDEPGAITLTVTDGGKAISILEVVEMIVPPLFPGDLPMDHKDDTDEIFCQLAALLEAHQETDFGRIQTRITSTLPTGLAKAYLSGLVAGTWRDNGLDNGRVTEKGLQAIEDVIFTFASLHLTKEKPRRKVKHVAKQPKGWNRKKA